jgi:nucleoside phosphorylase
LRPLFSRLPGANLVLDEAATVEQIAEEQLWMPVLTPDLEPWLEVALVVDESKSMLLWQRTIREVQRLLERYGIFRDVRTWGMIVDRVEDEEGRVCEQIRLRPGIGKAARHQRTHSPAELIDPLGRRLVLIATDCVESHWHDGTVLSALRTWSQSSSIAIIQMLPKWLWSKTALNLAAPVRFQSLLPGQPSQRLKAKPLDDWDEIDFKTGIQVPILTLEPEIVTIWSQLVAGKGGVWAPGFVFEPELFEPDEETEIDPDSNLSAEQRVEQFRKYASPIAWKLAKLLAAAPIVTLPVVRIIQNELLSKSRQVHVAEVILGGLLQPLQPLSEITPETNPDTIRYEFVQGVRAALIASSLRSDAVDVLMVVSKFIDRRLGRSISEFVAYLKDPKHIRDGEVLSNPIATVTAQILKQLGGEYVRYAEQLAVVDELSPDKKFERELQITKIRNRVALLIGVTENRSGSKLTPESLMDVDAMQRILLDPEMGGFAATDVIVLKNPRQPEMRDAINQLFNNREKDDLLLLYFSGHAIKDKDKSLHLSSCDTRKENGELHRPSVVSSDYIHQCIKTSRSENQICILDCDFSGAIINGITARNGVAILTSSTADEFSFVSNAKEYGNSGLSIFTGHLIEGIETGAADINEDGFITVNELHEYTSKRIKEIALRMNPMFYPGGDRYKITLAKVKESSKEQQNFNKSKTIPFQCAVIITSLMVEYMAVRQNLTDLQEEIHPQGVIYDRGKFTADDRVWDVGIVHAGAVNSGMAVEAERAIVHFNPDIVLFVGIAGGIKDVKIGDVVASTGVYAYESGKAGKTFENRAKVGLPAYELEQRAKAEARNSDWLKRISDVEPIPQVLVAPIVAGEKVIASTKSEVFKFIKSNYGDAVAVEMEGFGLFAAAQHAANHRVQAIVIRGISDVIDQKKDTRKEEFHEIAARNASAFAFEILAKLQLPNKSGLIPKLNSFDNTNTIEDFVDEIKVKVFISYTHDSQAYKARILTLADRLLKDGIDCNIDQYEESPTEGWQRWMLNQVEKADYVLIACSEEYDLRFRGNETYGKGANWEGSVIIQELYDAQGQNSKFIPITIDPEDTNFIPSSMRNATNYRLQDDYGYEMLYRRLTNQPINQNPILRKLPALPPRDRKHNFYDNLQSDRIRKHKKK